MSPAEQSEGIDWQKVFTVVVDIGVVVYVLWSMSPTFRFAVKGAVARLQSDWSMRRQQRIDEAWMTYQLREIRDLPEYSKVGE